MDQFNQTSFESPYKQFPCANTQLGKFKNGIIKQRNEYYFRQDSIDKQDLDYLNESILSTKIKYNYPVLQIKDESFQNLQTCLNLNKHQTFTDQIYLNAFDRILQFQFNLDLKKCKKQKILQTNDLIINSFYVQQNKKKLLYQLINSDYIQLFDIQKQKKICNINTENNFPSLKIIWQDNLIYQSTNGGQIFIYDFRNNQKVFQLNFFNNNILDVEVFDRKILSTLNKSINIKDLRYVKKNHVFDVINIGSFGINKVQLYQQENLFYSKIGDQIIQNYKQQHQSINLQRQLLDFQINEQNQELITLEGCKQIYLNFYRINSGSLLQSQKIENTVMFIDTDKNSNLLCLYHLDKLQFYDLKQDNTQEIKIVDFEISQLNMLRLSIFSSK